jgi:hypothetical protein
VPVTIRIGGTGVATATVVHVSDASREP